MVGDTKKRGYYMRNRSVAQATESEMRKLAKAYGSHMYELRLPTARKFYLAMLACLRAEEAETEKIHVPEEIQVPQESEKPEEIQETQVPQEPEEPQESKKPQAAKVAAEVAEVVAEVAKVVAEETK